jgi:hypothetical protein
MLARPILRTKGFPFRAGSGDLTVGTIATITDDTKYNAWPNVVLMGNGSLLMAYTKADNHNADNSGKVVGRIATEVNALAGTWGAEFDIADETLGAINVSLVALASGRVVVAYNLFNAPNTPTDSVRVRYSDNNGSTWSAAYTPDIAYTLTVTNGSAHMIQLRDGTVMMAVYGLNTSQTFYSASVLFSSDDGATWGGEVQVANGTADSRQYYEPSLTLVDNNDILCLMRTSNLAGDMRQSRSVDGGATWSAPAVVFGGYSPANAIQLTSRTLLATVRGNAAGKLEAFTSINRGASWTSQGILDATAYTEIEYGCPVQLSTGEIIDVYSVEIGSTNADVKTVIVTEDAA